MEMRMVTRIDLTPDELIKHDANRRERSDTSGSGADNSLVKMVNVSRKKLAVMLMFKKCQHLNKS